MSIDKDTVNGIAKLARIRLEEAQAETLVGELNNILSWVEQLGELETEGVEPMTSVVERKLPLRKDEVTDGGYPEKILANATDVSEPFFTVPKVVE